MHDVFHVFVLRHCVSGPTHVVDMSFLQLLDKGHIRDYMYPKPLHSIAMVSNNRSGQGPVGQI
jgi:hypothetical protein